MTKIHTFRCVVHKPGDYQVIPVCKQGGILGEARGPWKLAKLIKEHGLRRSPMSPGCMNTLILTRQSSRQFCSTLTRSQRRSSLDD